MSEVEFQALAAQGYNRVPLVLESFADLDTPLSLYLKLANRPYSFLLESVVGGERFGRYSFIGLPATTRLRARGRDIEVDQGGVVSERHDGDPLDFIAAFQRRYRAAPVPGLPRFCGGLAGYFAYDVVRHIEDRLAASAPPAIEALAEIPDVLLLLTEELAVVDNLQGKISLIVYADPAVPGTYRDAHERLQALAGTRSRGATRDADEALAEEMLADPKEIAEHVMLLDLGRNDVGRVAVTGTVKVTDQMIVERYSHVMHMVSNVEGTLRPGLTALDVLRASFPAGTVSGAPKVRAMEIIDELEPSRRGIYAGAVGYLSFQGDMDLAIAIRTALVKDGMLYAQVGAGIVHASVPESEWKETLSKARAVLRAAGVVQAGGG